MVIYGVLCLLLFNIFSYCSFVMGPLQQKAEHKENQGYY